MTIARLLTTAAAVLTLAATSSAFAQTYPVRPITFIVPYAVGGTTDIVARLVTGQIANGLGQPLVVDNRVGGGGLIGWSAVARSAPDGYTLLTTEMSFTIAPGLLPRMPFDSKKDFTHVITAASAPHVLVVNPGVPARTVQEFIALAKAKPGTMNYGSGGNATNTHLGGELFKSVAGVDLMHVPYKGAGQVLTDLMAGQVQALVTSLPTALPHIKSGKLRALVVTSDARSPLLPDVLSAKEANLPGFVMDFWVGFAAPAGTPQPAIDKLNQAIAAALNTADGKRRLAEQGLTPVANTPAQAAQQVNSEMQRWAGIVKSAGIKAEWSTMALQPLRGVRVLDLTNVLAGPFACHQRAHMGADVIKVEARNGGDLARQLGADHALNQAHMGVSFLAQNPGKRSITLNLKHPKGKEALRRLVRTADVLVENYRPGVMQRLELGYEALLKENPRLIYCAISGFGQDGPLRDLPAYDQIIQSMSGVMSITGAPENAPYRVGYPVADTIGGITAAFAVAAALADRQRTGGVFIDVSMLEAAMATMGWAVSNHLIAGRAPQPLGNDNVTASPSGTFRTGDGLLNIAANKQEQFKSVCAVLGHPEWVSDPRFADRHGRLQHRAELKALVEEDLSHKSANDWWALFNAAGVPAGPVYSVPQALEHPQIAARGMVGTFENVPGVGRDIRVVRTGFKLNGEPPTVDTPPPQLGQHTAAILAELGYSEAEIQAHIQEKVV